jgi:hypothetical protein
MAAGHRGDGPDDGGLGTGEPVREGAQSAENRVRTVGQQVADEQVVDEQPGDAVPVLRGRRVPHGDLGPSGFGVPRGADGVQSSELARLLDVQLGLQHLPEQRMDPEAARSVRGLFDERVGVRQTGENAPDVPVAAEPVDEFGPELGRHAGAQQHAADAGRLTLQHLREQVLRHAAVVVRQRRDEPLRRHALFQRPRGEPETDGPPLRLPLQRPGDLDRDGNTGSGEELTCLLRREGELVGADLAE